MEETSAEHSGSNNKRQHALTTSASSTLSAKKQPTLVATPNAASEVSVEKMDDTQLRELLEEAITYKNPCDIGNKSDYFKQLLKKTTEEAEQRNLSIKRASQRHQHGGSLQDLPEALSNELFYTTPNYGSINSANSNVNGKRHQRQKKYSSSVSSRQREGGSLPCNVNVSTSLPSANDHPFLNEYKKNQKQVKIEIKNDDTVIDMGDDGETMHLLAHDSLAQGVPYSGVLDGVELKPIFTNSLDLEISAGGERNLARNKSSLALITTMSSATNSTTSTISGSTLMSSAVAGSTSIPSTISSISSASSVQCVDQGINISLIDKSKHSYQQHVMDGSTINHSNNIVLTNHSTVLGNGSVNGGKESSAIPNYNFVSSITKFQSTRFEEASNNPVHIPIQSMPSATLTNTTASNGGPISTPASKDLKGKKQRIPKSERNVTTYVVPETDYTQDVNTLLSFIENDSEKINSKPKNGILHPTAESLLNKKKNQPKNKPKLKKCNSLEELSSATRHQVNSKPIVVDSPVALRSKSINTANVNNNAKKPIVTDKVMQPQEKQNKRNERRSWGTEELNYLGENAALDQPLLKSKISESASAKVTKETKEPIKDGKEDSSSSSSSSNGESLSIVSIEQVTTNTSESAEFHVVTKKRKSKRRSVEEQENPKLNSILSYSNSKRDGYNHRQNGKQQEREIMKEKSGRNSGKAASSKGGKNRRKSTSSVPPSEKSDSSDLDSVHSLPIETTKTTSSLLVGTSTAAAVNEPTSKSKDLKESKTKSKSVCPSVISYADIAKTSAPKLTDKWPSVSNKPIGEANITSPEIQQPEKLTFPELVEKNNHKNKTVNGIEEQPEVQEISDSNNNVQVSAKKVISYSQIMETKELIVESPPISEFVETSAKTALIKSKSVDHNNLYSSDQYPALEKTFSSQKNKSQPLLVNEPIKQDLAKMVTTIAAAIETTVKKLKPPTKPQQTQSIIETLHNDRNKQISQSERKKPSLKKCNNAANRPAVIIMNDNEVQEESSGLTFGFDIDEKLLFEPSVESSLQSQSSYISLEIKTNCDINDKSVTNLTDQEANTDVELLSNGHPVPPPPQPFICTKSESILEVSQSSDLGYLSSSITTPPNQKMIHSTMPNLSVRTNGVEDLNNNHQAVAADISNNSLPTKILIVQQLPEKMPKYVQPAERVQSAFNYDKIVHFVGEEWEKLIRNGVTYYEEQ